MIDSQNSFHGKDVHEIIEVFANVLNIFLKSDLNPLPGEQTGIYFYLQEIWNSVPPYSPIKIGSFTDEGFVDRCCGYSSEKTSRVIRRFIDDGHILSFQSAVPEDKEYAGGIISSSEEIAGAVSGLSGSKTFPGEDDEAVTAVAFIILGWVKNKEDFIDKILSISNNQTLIPLYELATSSSSIFTLPPGTIL